MIVVGAGVAGMAATGELARAGFSVLLLEARDRIGGRVFTDRRRGWPGPVELGAEFVHDGNDPFWRLMRRHGLRTRRIPPRHWRFNGATLEPINDVAAAIERVTRRIDSARMRGWSFADFLRFKARTIADADRELASGFVEGFEAAPLDEMSAPALEGETLQDEKQFVLPAGYDSIITALQKEWRGQPVTLHLRTPVHAIEWRRGRVEVQAGNRGFSAAAAMVTLPLGVLQAQPPARGAVRFIPPLRDKERVLSAMRMGQVIRISLRIDGRKWDRVLPARLARIGRPGFGFIHSRMAGIPVWWNLGAGPVLTGWAGGPAALALTDRSAAAIRESALTSLSRVFGTAKAPLRAAVADWATHNWSQDPFARGAYSFISAGQERAAEHLRKAVSDTLYFAGEATAGGGETGTVHGALASGLRAAAELSRALRLNAGMNSRRRARRRPR